MTAVIEGRWSTGVPFLRLGDGPPLVVASGMTSEHVNPAGVWRRMALSWAAPFARHFTVYLVNRRPGVAEGTTMSDFADDYAHAFEHDLGGPVLLHGTSTGGSIALQLAIDHPGLVRRMVVSAAACRLTRHAREVMAEVTRAVQEGDGRRASALVVQAGTALPGAAARGLGWLTGGSMTPADPSDMLRTIAAEDTFDVEPDLGRIEAPTLVLGGGADGFYSEDLFRRTAAGIPQGRVVILPGKSHVHVAGSKVAAGIALGYLLG